METEEIKSIWAAEKAEVTRQFKETTSLAKDREIILHYKIYEASYKALLEKYARVVQMHLNTYKNEYETYFNGNSAPLVAFDVEEFHNETACILGLHVDAQLHVNVFLESLRKASSPEETTRITRTASAWLRGKKDRPIVLTHGFNEKEREIAGNSCHQCVNTQLILPPIVKASKGPEYNGASLLDFENVIQFKRAGCEFLKHAKFMKAAGVEKKDLAFLFPKQAKLSIWNLADGKPPRQCRICGKEQDVFMYCLEDTFVTMLIFLHAKNHGFLR
jgi:hypothetical protein